MATYYVSSGVTSTGIALNGDSMYVLNGGVANSTTIASSGNQYVSSGGTVNSTTITSSGNQYVSSGGVVNNTTITSSGNQYVSSGGVANSTTITTSGNQYISSGGIASSIIIGSGGYLHVSSGGVALDVLKNYSGAINATVYGGDSQTQITGTHESGSFYLSNGVACNFLLNSGNTLQIFSGGVANSTTISYGGCLYVDNGGTATSTVISSGGSQYVGGTATSTIISSGGLQYVSSGGMAVNTVINSGSQATNGTVAGTTINSGGHQEIYSNGIANSTIINLGGSQTVSIGGATNSTTINFGAVQKINGGTVTSTIINSASIQIVTGNNSYTGTADYTTISYGGSQIISNGIARNTIIGSGGIQNIYNGKVENTVLTGGRQYIYGNGRGSGTIINSAGIQDLIGGSATSTTINYGGSQIVSATGAAISSIINSGGKQFVSSGGTANDTVIHSGGSMIAEAGISLVGMTVIGGTMSVLGAIFATGAAITFAVNERQTTDIVMVSDIGNISGAYYSITVNADQSAGSYRLAGNAASFASGIMLTVGETSLGVLLLNETGLTDKGKTYSLTLDNHQTLVLSIVTFPNTNLLANGYSQIVAWDAAGGKVGYVATDGQAAPAWTGIWEWGSSEAAMWKVVGVGRFSADVEQDGILLYNGNGNTFAAWTDLGRGDYGYVSLCHVDGNFQTLALADFDNNGLDDVIIYDENGSFGIVSDAAAYHDVWHVDNMASNVQQVIGAGYFGNADGKSDILVKKTDENAYFLWHNEDSTFDTWNWSQAYLGSLDNDWTVAAIGDFQGDGVDDIIMWQKSTGFMYAWEDGKASNQRWVGALDASQWEVAAVGDYNGDGKEDLLLRELVSGWGGVGYWAGANASNWTDLNARIETDMESKFAVVA